MVPELTGFVGSLATDEPPPLSNEGIIALALIIPKTRNTLSRAAENTALSVIAVIPVAWEEIIRLI